MPEVLSYLCPFCDREVRVGQTCPGCAAKAAGKKRKKRKKTAKSWDSSPGEDGLGLPDDSFDYEDFCKREFGKSPHHRTGLKWYWWALGIVVLAGMLAGALWI